MIQIDTTDMDEVFSVINTFPRAALLAIIFDAGMRHKIADRIHNLSARKQLMEYEGTAPYLVLFGPLMVQGHQTFLSDIPEDTPEEVCGCVAGMNKAMAKFGLRDARWLSISARPTLRGYMSLLKKSKPDGEVLH